MITTAIVAMDMNRGIGFKDEIPWDIPQDRAYFKRTCKDWPTLFGRRTWNKIKQWMGDFKIPVVVRRDGIYINDSFKVASDLEDYYAQYHSSFEKTYIAGGSWLYHETLELGLVQALDITLVHRTHKCDKHFPEIPSNFEMVRCDFNPEFTRMRFQRQ